MLFWRAEDLSRGPHAGGPASRHRRLLSSPVMSLTNAAGASAFLRRSSRIAGLRGRVPFDVVSWDDPAARIAMLANQTPQASVNRALPRPAECDIVCHPLVPHGNASARQCLQTEWRAVLFRDRVGIRGRGPITAQASYLVYENGGSRQNSAFVTRILRKSWTNIQRVEQFFNGFSKIRMVRYPGAFKFSRSQAILASFFVCTLNSLHGRT